MKKIAIVGAGISGLVLACFLKKNKNYDISVYEKDDIYLPNSNGIQISPNALRILKKINFDLFDQKKLCKITGLSFYDYNLNAKIARMSFDYLKNDLYITLNRNELINFLINQFSLKDNIILKEVTNINDKSIFFKNDSEEKFDTLIVADGIFSKLRPEKIQPVYSGYSALRGVFTDTIQVNDIDLWMGKNFHLVKYPIDQNKNFSFTLVKKMPFVKVVDGYDSKFKDINKNNNFYFPKFDNMTFDNIKVKIWPIYKLNKIFYGHNDIYFIGDSAHGFIPSRAQGAAQAVEDSYALYNFLIQNEFCTKKLYKFRKNRIKKIITKSENNLTIFHLNIFMFRWIRNLIIKLICSYEFLIKFVNSSIFDYKIKEDL